MATGRAHRIDTDESPRLRILAAARGLVLSKGHARLSLREVARKAGYSPASLYEHFDGKDAIVAALSAEASSALRLALSRASATGRTAAERLVSVGAAYVAFARERPEDFLLLFRELPSGRRSLRQAVPETSTYGIVVEAAGRAVEERGRRGRDRQVAEELAYGVWAAAHGMAMLQLTHLKGFDANFEEADRRLLGALVSGYLA